MSFNPSEKKILVVDDDQVARELMAEVFNHEGFEVLSADNGHSAMELFNLNSVDLVISDIRMGVFDGLDLLKAIKQKSPQTPVILLTAFGSMTSAVEALKEGAFDYISKPYRIDSLIQMAKKALRNSKLEKSIEIENVSTDSSKLLGHSQKMIEVFKIVARAALSSATTLITGESGTGKEMLAQAIHKNSTRSPHKLIAINCGALAESLLESELFGHKKGSFTGALETRKGLFEEANEGTLFLDEIGEMPLQLQVKLLRVLQESEIRPLGSNETKKIDVRIIAATHRNLEKLIESGLFREDLYYRLNVISIHVPPLRERKEDLPELIAYFLKKYSQKKEGLVYSITEKAMEILYQHPWPGNVRELQNVIERAVAMANSSLIDDDDFKNILQKKSGPLPSTLDDIEKARIQEVLKSVNNNKTKAAEILGIDRVTLYRKLQKFHLND